MCFRKLLFFILLFQFFSLTAFADAGPKDMLTVYIENPPDELFYLDVLTQESKIYNNFGTSKREALDPKILGLLDSLADEGWRPAFSVGTGVPMWGTLRGTQDNGRMVHQFGYVGLPTTYRIIIATESGKVSVSDVLTRKTLQSSVTFDYATGKATVPPVFVAYLLQFLITFSFTILIEGIILLLFRFKLKDNWKVFLAANFITQIFLNLTVGITLIKGGTMNAYIVLLPVELVILGAETLIYKRFLSGADDRRRTWYGLTANLVSWLCGVYILHHLFSILNKLL